MLSWFDLAMREKENLKFWLKLIWTEIQVQSLKINLIWKQKRKTTNTEWIAVYFCFFFFILFSPFWMKFKFIKVPLYSEINILCTSKIFFFPGQTESIYVWGDSSIEAIFSFYCFYFASAKEKSQFKFSVWFKLLPADCFEKEINSIKLWKMARA